MIDYKFLDSIFKRIYKLDSPALKDVTKNLSKEIKMYITLFNSMSEGVIVIDELNKIQFYNKMSLKILNIAETKLIGTVVDKIIKNQSLCTLLRQYINSKETIRDLEFKIDNLYAKYISISVIPLVEENKIIGKILLLDDISREKEKEQRLRRAESLSALTTFAAGIAHEIKNPLGAMSIHIQLLQKEIKESQNTLSDDFKFSVGVLQEEIERLNDLVVNFLFTVRPLNTELELVNLSIYLNKFCDFILPQLKQKKIILKKKYNKLPDIWIDKKLFKQALLNLVENSLNSIDSHNKKGFIQVEAFAKKNYVYINLLDNGQGIPAEVQAKIFDPYFTTKKYGTGLGLTIVYKIIKELKGALEFYSRPGETVFTIQLPIPLSEKDLITFNGE